MKLALGVDIGTTKSAVVIVELETRTLLAVESVAHNCQIESGIQDGTRHIDVILDLIKRLPENLRNKIGAIGITGQMHGVICWSTDRISPLYTWQYQNKNIDEVKKLFPELANGFGITTLAELFANGMTSNETHAGTIHDFLAWNLIGKSGKVQMDYSNAHSWGLFDLSTKSFRSKDIAKLGINLDLLPEVVEIGAKIGKLELDCGLPLGIDVFAPIGDNQSSVLATMKSAQTEIYLTLGTGAQVSVVTDKFRDDVPMRPFLNGEFLAVVSPLCGGAAWAILHKNLKMYLEELGINKFSDSELYDFIDKLAINSLDDSDLPIVNPSFSGERHNANLRGSIEGLNLENYTPGKVAAAWALGIIRNLYSSMPQELLTGREDVLVSGNAIRKTKALQLACEKVFGCNLIILNQQEEAAVGSALLTGGF